MRTRALDPSLFLVSALVLSLILGGCDSVTPVDEAGPAPSSSATLFEETSDVEARMTGLHDTAPVTPPKAGGEASPAEETRALALASVSRVAAPRDTMQVSALTHADGALRIGYNTPGAAFGGAVDRLDASAPTRPPTRNSLRSDVVDVESVARGDEDGPLYVTGALHASAYDGDLRGSPAALLRIDGREGPQATVAGLPGSTGERVIPVPGRETEHDVYVATDEDVVHRFDAALENETTRDVSGTALMSVAATPSAVFASGRDGGVYGGEMGAEGSLAPVSGLEAERIKELEARSGSALEGERLFLALGAGGMAVLDAASGDVLFRRESPTYTSVTLHENDPEVPNEPTDLVYAARPDGRLDVYRVSDRGLDTGDISTGLQRVGTIDLQQLGGAEFGAATPVTKVIGVGCHAYAASTAGVVAMKMGTMQGCGTGGHQLPAASDDSAETTEREATTTAVLANDTDPDGALDASTVQVQEPPAHGTVRVDESNGEVTYTPEPGFTGTDEYTYTVTDEDGWTSSEATVTMTVKALAPPPPPGG